MRGRALVVFLILSIPFLARIASPIVWREVVVQDITLRSKHDVVSGNIGIDYNSRSFAGQIWPRLMSTSENSIVQVECRNRTMTDWDCLELSRLKTIVVLKCGGCTFPSGGFRKIIDGNPNLLAIWVEGCIFEAQDRDLTWVCDETDILYLGTFGSDLTLTAKEDRKIILYDDEPMCLLSE